jgi:hypothetical protein
MSDLEETIVELVRSSIARKIYEGSPVDRAACLHEAGHALGVWSCRASALRSVSVDYLGGGETDNHAPRPAGTPAEPREAVLERLRRDHPVELAAAIRRQCVAILAGRVADERGEYRLPASCSQSDRDEVDFLAESTVGRDEVDGFLAPLQAAATSLVAAGFPVICELASLLSYERKLPGAFLEAWFEERAAARSLRDRWGAAFQQPVEAAA